MTDKILRMTSTLAYIPSTPDPIPALTVDVQNKSLTLTRMEAFDKAFGIAYEDDQADESTGFTSTDRMRAQLHAMLDTWLDGIEVPNIMAILEEPDLEIEMPYLLDPYDCFEEGFSEGMKAYQDLLSKGIVA
jgi:hypothetical protein